jgi:ubiquinone/menaquinone biosynthesis C-methylase UbiE
MHAKGEQSRHDWHSANYVDGWIAKDVKREERRRPLLARMMALAPFAVNAPIRILDVAGGYGAVSEAALIAFPNARVTIHDYSEIMLERACKHFANGPAPIAYVQGDLTDSTWTTRAGGPFDLVVSGIAIHNLEEPALIADCYRAIRTLLVPGGCFLNCDHFERAGGVEEHLGLLRDAGYEHVGAPWIEASTGITKAMRGA